MIITKKALPRRTFLRGAGGLGAAGLLTGPALACSSPPSRGRRVAVLGGGVAGLTAAHELAERGFHVTVYEPTALGGKARSIPVPDTAGGGSAQHRLVGTFPDSPDVRGNARWGRPTAEWG